MREAKVVTCFLLRRPASGDEVLLLRRSQRVGTYRGRWAAVSGYLEAEPLVQAYREIEEEAGLAADEVTLLRAGDPLVVVDTEADRRWIVHPFLFEVRPDAQVRVDWEHTEARWVQPEEVFAFDTVPQLAEALTRVYPLQSR
jgi:8-oxo-dGTP diphosphatase